MCVCVYSRQRILVETETSYLPENKSFLCDTQRRNIASTKNEINMKPYKSLYTMTEWDNTFLSNRKACIKGLEVGIVKTSRFKIHYIDNSLIYEPLLSFLNPVVNFLNMVGQTEIWQIIQFSSRMYDYSFIWDEPKTICAVYIVVL